MEEILIKQLLNYLYSEREKLCMVKMTTISKTDLEIGNTFPRKIQESLDELNSELEKDKLIINSCIEFFESPWDNVSVFTMFYTLGTVLESAPFTPKQKLQILFIVMNHNIQKLSLGIDAPVVVVDVTKHKFKHLTERDLAMLTRIADPLAIDLDTISDLELREKFRELREVFEETTNGNGDKFKENMFKLKKHYFNKKGMLTDEDIKIVMEVLTNIGIPKNLVRLIPYTINNRVNNEKESVDLLIKFVEAYYANDKKLFNQFVKFYQDNAKPQDYEEQYLINKTELIGIERTLNALKDMFTCSSEEIFVDFPRLSYLLDISNVSNIDKANILLAVFKRNINIIKRHKKSYPVHNDEELSIQIFHEIIDERYFEAKTITEQDIDSLFLIFLQFDIKSDLLDEIRPLFKPKEEVKKESHKLEENTVNYKELRKRLYQFYNNKENRAIRTLTLDELEECIDLLYQLGYDKNSIREFIYESATDIRGCTKDYNALLESRYNPADEYERIKEFIKTANFDCEDLVNDIEYCIEEIHSDSIDEEMYNLLADTIRADLTIILEQMKNDSKEIAIAKLRLGII